MNTFNVNNYKGLTRRPTIRSAECCRMRETKPLTFRAVNFGAVSSGTAVLTPAELARPHASIVYLSPLNRLTTESSLQE
jgi:hypothetical protein